MADNRTSVNTLSTSISATVSYYEGSYMHLFHYMASYLFIYLFIYTASEHTVALISTRSLMHPVSEFLSKNAS